MKYRKPAGRFCAILLCSTMLASLLTVPAYADSERSTWRMNNLTTQESTKYEVPIGNAQSFDEIYSILKEEAYSVDDPWYGPTTYINQNDRLQCYQYDRVVADHTTKIIGLQDGKSIEFKHPVRFFLADPSTNLTDAKQLGPAIRSRLTSPLTVSHDLAFRSGNSNGVEVWAQLEIEKPITVKSGATLLLDNCPHQVDDRHPGFHRDIFVNAVQTGPAVTVEAGGILRLGAVELKNADGVNTPFAKVDGGTVTVQVRSTHANINTNIVIPSEETDLSASPTLAQIVSPRTLIQAGAESTVNIKGGEITASKAPLVLATGGGNRLNISGGKIDASAPLLQVSGAGNQLRITGGTLTLQDGGLLAAVAPQAQALALSDTPVPAADASALDVTIGGKAVINLESGADPIPVTTETPMTLKGGKISAVSGPAIKVEPGAKLVIDGDEAAAPLVTTEREDTQAILLAKEAIVEKAGTSVVVAKETDEASNYVDNSGNIILAAGATKKDPVSEEQKTLNAAVILPDGTLVEGTEKEAPKVVASGDGQITTVNVPAGGKVQKPNEAAPTTLEQGGSVTHNGETTEVVKKEIPVESVTLNADAQSLYVGKTVTLTATITPENATDASVIWTTDDETVATVDGNGVVTGVSKGTAVIKAAAGEQFAECMVTVKKKSSSSGSNGTSSPTYTVSVIKTENGTVSVSPKSAEKGDTVTITVKPDEGYELDRLSLTGKNGDTIKLTEKGDGKYTFIMPTYKVSVEARFVAISKPSTGLPFTDVNAGDYYYDAVAWALEKGITSGASATAFTPEAPCTRAQVVTFLWRAAGSPIVDHSNSFTDVDRDAYYYNAVLWAVEKGITSGTSAAAFTPDAPCTRGQIVTFLHRHGGLPIVPADASFEDVTADAYYAQAVAWAAKEGITSGTGNNNFSPDADCTRGQIVTFLYRYMVE